MELHTLEAASADASFRRYFRATTSQGSFVIMDAPPDKEDVQPFVSIAQQLAELGVHTPIVHAQDLENGFLMLEDLGNRTYLDDLLNNASALYSAAIATLIDVQKGQQEHASFNLPVYNKKRLNDEMDLFKDWFIYKHLKEKFNSESSNVLEETKAFLISECLAQPQVWVHRDYHSRNLMITEHNSPGVIDFQDMVVGPIAYDLASLFKDCYIEWPREQQLEWLAEYHELSRKELSVKPFSFTQLVRWYDLAGLQRHLKVLGIFCRLYYRDGKENYLNDLPLVAKYALEVLELYPELCVFKQHFAPHIRSVL